MARFIDAELIPFSRDYSRFVATEDDVDSVPTADVVEVVRCKDCKWWHTEGCVFRKDAVEGLPTADDFCSHGERKE